MKQEHGIFRYEEIARKIEAIVTNLSLKTGDRLPSVRKICKELNVSATTVFHAYTILESKGLISSRARSGFFVSGTTYSNLVVKPAEKYIPLPNQVSLNNLIGNMQRNISAFGLINFSIVAPVNEQLPISGMSKCIREALKDINGQSFQYPLIEGHPKLVEQIARRSFDWDVALSIDDILVTNGCIEAINLCLDAVAKPGDIIIVESPAPYGILQSLESRKLLALEVSSTPYNGIDLNQLEIAVLAHKVAACVITTVCGVPIGGSMPKENIIRLLAILGKSKIPLIEDDALGDLTFAHPRPLPAKAYDKENQVLYCTSFSKSLGSGFRIGWVSGGLFHEEVKRLKYTANFFTNGILQDAIGRFLESGQYNVHLKKMKIAIQKNLARYLHSIYKYFPAGVNISNPKGGFSLWIELPTEIDGLELTRRALKEGIGIFPGEVFSTSAKYDNYIRINYCPIWNTKIDRYLNKLALLIKNYK
jgi:DNA-binding transcriptional MocR family regulator